MNAFFLVVGCSTARSSILEILGKNRHSWMCAQALWES